MTADHSDLVQRLRFAEGAGQRLAQRQLYDLCRDRLGRYFRSRLRNPADADDYVHEVFVKALEGIQRGNEPKDIAAWLTGIAWNMLKRHYEELKHYSDVEVPEDHVRDHGVVLELANELTDDDRPDQPADFETLLGKRELWRIVQIAITAISPSLRKVITKHIELNVALRRKITSAELGEALGMRASQVDRQLHRARLATVNAAAALVLARSGRSACPDLGLMLAELLTEAQLAAGHNLVLEPKQSDKVLKHAAGCAKCGAGADNARDYVNWVLGPGLVFADDDERRRMLAALFGRASDAPAAVAVAEPTVAALEKVVDKPTGPGGSLPILSRVTGSRLMTSITQLAHDPIIVRALASTAAAVVLGICGLITASAPFPPPAYGEALQPPPISTTPKPTDPSSQNPGPVAGPPTTTTTTTPKPQPGNDQPAQAGEPAPNPPAPATTTSATQQSQRSSDNQTQTGATETSSTDSSSTGTTTTETTTTTGGTQAPRYENTGFDLRDTDYMMFGVSGGGNWQATTAVQHQKLTPGRHFLMAVPGQQVWFTVADDNTVDYDHSQDGMFGGRGTNTLVVHGIPMTLDNSGVDYSNSSVSGVGWKAPQPKHTFKLLPGQHQVVTTGSPGVPFAITPDGHVDYAAEQDRVLDGQGTSTLTLRGLPVTLNTTDLDDGNTTIGGINFKAPGTSRVFQLLPGAHQFLSYTNIQLPFVVSPEGTVGYRADLQGTLTGSGTRTLAVHGVAVTLNTAGIDYLNTTIGGIGWQARQPSRTYKILAGPHEIVTYNNLRFQFTVGKQGEVGYKPELGSILSGSGTSTLTVRGFTITLDTNDIDYGNTTVGAVDWKAPRKLQEFKLLPGAHEIVTNNSIKLPFTVSPDGHVEYKPELRGTFTGGGTTALAIHGLTLTFNTTEVDYADDTINGIGWQGRQAIRTYKLLPGPHDIITYGNIKIPFTFTPQGTVTYPADVRGTLTGEGTSTLALHGVSITFDGRECGTAYFGVSGAGYWVSPQLKTLRLAPGPHVFALQNTTRYAFQVTKDGHVEYDHSLDGVLSGRGGSTLVVRQR
ncbi:RNA polymerase sigma factor [Actinocrispum sp. NPDC049592]|uniref:RNA polymerase sigma factor n=1 Tax=Actinocrispum sp. NPDC049592 TaxID=3154835 RepID=UPI0034289818